MLEESKDDDEDWMRIEAGADSNFDRVDHTTLSSKESLISNHIDVDRALINVLISSFYTIISLYQYMYMYIQFVT